MISCQVLTDKGGKDAAFNGLTLVKAVVELMQ